MCNECKDTNSWGDFFAIFALLCIFIFGISVIAYYVTTLGLLK